MTLTTGKSEETLNKQKELAGIVQMHARICHGIMHRNCVRTPYTVYDINAGPGRYEVAGVEVEGSPLIIRRVLREVGLPFEAHFIEQDPDAFADLQNAMAPCDNGCRLHMGNHDDICPLLWPSDGIGRYGFIYHDPNPRREIGFNADLLERAARLPAFRCLDFISYVSGTGLKRFAKAFGDAGLQERLARINKEHWIVRTPRTSWQWTMLIGTNWKSMPEWKRRGYHSVESYAGREILSKLALTADEYKERQQCLSV